MIYFTSDTHFGHRNILLYNDRPGLSDIEKEYKKEYLKNNIRFKPDNSSVEAHDTILINNINKTVDKNDVLYHLGDFCFPSKYKKIKSYLDRIHCNNIYLILGNHDDNYEMNGLFKERNDIHYITHNNQKIVMCHYAMAIWYKSNKGSFHLYGHSHSNAEKALDNIFTDRRSMDVGMDNAYNILGEHRPFSYEEIHKILIHRKGHSLDHHE